MGRWVQDNGLVLMVLVFIGVVVLGIYSLKQHHAPALVRCTLTCYADGKAVVSRSRNTAAGHCDCLHGVCRLGDVSAIGTCVMTRKVIR